MSWECPVELGESQVWNLGPQEMEAFRFVMGVALNHPAIGVPLNHYGKAVGPLTVYDA